MHVTPPLLAAITSALLGRPATVERARVEIVERRPTGELQLHVADSDLHPERPGPPAKATAGDRARACDFMSRVLCREVRGGFYVDQLAAMLADERAAEGQRLALAAIPVQRGARTAVDA